MRRSGRRSAVIAPHYREGRSVRGYTRGIYIDANDKRNQAIIGNDGKLKGRFSPKDSKRKDFTFPIRDNLGRIHGRESIQSKKGKFPKTTTIKFRGKNLKNIPVRR